MNYRIRWLLWAVFLFSVSISMVAVTNAQSESTTKKITVNDINWKFGPFTGKVGSQALIHVPKGYFFLNTVETDKFLKLNQNLPTGRDYVLAPNNMHWAAYFDYSDTGHIKDDEELDAKSILKKAKDGNVLGNAAKKKLGYPTLTLNGWRFPPRYDNNTKLLEWAFLLTQDQSGKRVINYQTRFLARTGVMKVVLVANPNRIDSAVQEFKHLLGGYSFTPGNKYSEFKQGDRTAEYGLAALIAGGAAAVATKKGFFTVIAGALAAAWKIVAAVVLGLFAWIGSLFKKKE